jgi:ferrous iron transport protein A
MLHYSQGQRDLPMKTLHQIPIGSKHTILKINAQDDTLRHLNHLGFRLNEKVTLISHLGHNIIVSLNGTRFGLDLSLAALIEVDA